MSSEGSPRAADVQNDALPPPPDVVPPSSAASGELPPPPDVPREQPEGEQGADPADRLEKAPEEDSQPVVKQIATLDGEDGSRRKEHGDKGREKDRRRSRSRSKSKRGSSRRSKSRSRSRGRRSSGKRSSRSRSRERRSGRRRSGSREHRRRSRSLDQDRRRRRSPSPEAGYPRMARQPTRGESAGGGAGPIPAPMSQQPMPAPPAPDPLAIQRMLQQQQQVAQQMLLQQQLLSANSVNSAKAQKEARAARRVYVGNLQPHMVTEEQLKAIFNSALMAAFPGSSIPGMEPVIAINRHSEGRYAFVELRTPEMATAALQLSNQVTLHGRAMTCERPQDYVDPAKQAQMAQLAMAALQHSQQMPMPGMMQGMALPGPPPLPQ